MNLDKMKTDLKKIKPANLKKAASKAAHIRIRMTRRRWIAAISSLVLIGVALFFILRPKPPVVILPIVEVEPVNTEDVNIYGEYVGRIRAQQFVEIRARVEGFLEKMLFAEGTYVKKG